MKRIEAVLFSICCVLAVSAQTLNIQVGEVTYQVPSAQAGDMIYSSGTTLTVLDKVFSISDITKMYVDNATVADNSVSVVYNGTSSVVKVAGNIMKYLDVKADGSDVTIVQDSLMAEEVTYSLSGNSADGSFTMNGKYKASLILDGLTLTNSDGAPVHIDNGKRIDLTISGTNTLADGSASEVKGCLYIKGHTEIDGDGTLTVNAYGTKAHGIYSGEYIQLKKSFTGNINIGTTTKDGIHCEQYFQMNSGNITITKPGDDGIQAEASEDEDYDEDEPDGSCIIKGGSITVTTVVQDTKGICCDNVMTINDKFSVPVINVTGAATSYASKGIKADTLRISAGTFTIAMTGKGIWDSDDNETSACSCLKADYMDISGGTLTLKATGAGGKGIGCDDKLLISGGEITATTSGGCYVYTGGKEYTNYTGSLDNIGTAYKSCAKGIKVGDSTNKTGDVTISGGTVKVKTSTNGAEGIECKGTININGGNVDVASYDDAINSGKTMTITDGTIKVDASKNDGLDSNGDMWIKGGNIIAYGTTEPEAGIDANEEQNYHVYFTGGIVLGIGGTNSVPANSKSTQPYVTGSGTVTSGTTISLKSGSTVLASFAVTRSYSGGGSKGPGGPGGPGDSKSKMSILISCPGLTKGSTYTLVNGTTSSNVTAAQYSSSRR